MEKRLFKLYHNGYLDWPSQEQRRRAPLPESVCWLGWRGALLLGERWGLNVDPLGRANENQLRKLEGVLRRQGFHWMREPRWIQLQHDLAVVDFRLLLEKSLQECEALKLSDWLNEGAFRSQMDVVEYKVEGQGGVIKKMRKGVLPDAYFVLDDERRRLNGQPYRARFLLELDMATHDNPSFGSEKFLPGAAYISSPEYKKRFGNNSGRWLILTTAGQRRMENLMHQCEEKVGGRAALFYFTTFELLERSNLLISDIWYQVGSARPMPLI